MTNKDIKTLNKLIGSNFNIRFYENRCGNISFEPSNRFRFTIYNKGTEKNPKYMIRKFNISHSEYPSVWIINRSNGNINWLTSISELITYLINYITTDKNRLSERYYNCRFGLYSKHNH